MILSVQREGDLRTLRLFHWTQAQAFRKLASTTASGHMAAEYNKSADVHIKFVQVLNDFFPIGDTAEQDAGK